MFNTRYGVPVDDSLLLPGVLGDRQRDLLAHPGLNEEEISSSQEGHREEVAAPLPREDACRAFTAKEKPTLISSTFECEEENTA